MKQLLLILFAAAMVDATAAEEILPNQPPLSRYTSEWERSPFNRIVVRVVDNKVISAFAKNLVLEGVVADDAKGLTAYVRDRTDGSFAVITEQSTEDQPLRIVGHNRMDDPRETSIKISDGSEEAEITYERDSMTRPIQQDAPVEPNTEKPSPSNQQVAPVASITEKPSPTSQQNTPPASSTPPLQQGAPPPGAATGKSRPLQSQKATKYPPGVKPNLEPAGQ